MRVIKGIEIPIAICVSYTILSIINASIELVIGNEVMSVLNSFMMLLWTSIAVFILSIHHLFEKWSPPLMIVIQYIIAMGLVMLSIIISGIFEELHPNTYRDAFRSFTIPYVIGGTYYYFNVFYGAKRQNKILQEIKALKRINKN